MAACFGGEDMKIHRVRGPFTLLKTPELRLGDFLLPWGMGIGTIGFLAAWIAVARHGEGLDGRAESGIFRCSLSPWLFFSARWPASSLPREDLAPSPRYVGDGRSRGDCRVTSSIGDTPRSRGRGTVRSGRMSWASRRAWPGRLFKFPSRTTRRSKRAICFLKSTLQLLRRQ